MSQDINTAPASGTRDFLPNQLRLREKVFQIVKDSFESFGFQPLQTPAFERLEVLSGKYGDEGEKLIFKILKRGEKEQSGEADLALRYDLTVPALRAFANHRQELPTIFKRYQIGQVWRADRPGKERFREFTQCDIDIYGTPAASADLEILLVINQTFRRLGLNNHLKIHVNSRLFLQEMANAYRIPTHTAAHIMVILDKADKIGMDAVAQQIVQAIDQQGVAHLCQDFLHDMTQKNAKHLVVEKVGQQENGRKIIHDIQWLIQQVQLLQPNTKIVFDPFLVRGLSYYTGFIFEVFSEENKGALSAGGRYDNLSRTLIGHDMPICGGSLGIERIILLLEKTWQNTDHQQQTFFLTVWDQNMLAVTTQFAQELRLQGLHVYLDLSAKEIKHQLKFADKNGYRFCLIIGPDEITNQQVVVKDLVNQKQEKISCKDYRQVTQHLKKLVELQII